MREWIVRLNTIDGGAAEALRVIEHFDTLVDQRSSALAMLRAAAALADCPAGLEDPERGLRLGVNAAGRTLADVGSETPSRQVQRFEEITVWLDRDESAWPLDHLILERFARSLHAVKKSRDTSPVVAALRTVCDPNVLPAERDNALRRLGVGPTVTVAVTHAADARRMPPGLVVDDHQINLFAGSTAPQAIPRDIAAGMHTCTAAEVPRGWQHARTALRIAVELTTGEPTHVRYDQLGCIATVVESVDADAAAQAPDVRRVIELQTQRPWVVATLEAVLSHSSIREVARLQNLHHSTMRQRIDWLERQLGYPPLSSSGYARASTTLTLWRIAMAADRQHPASAPATVVCR
ncbi:helix-turn-helix domain-containing protein [Nocardia sp. CA2R105]|uniref:helix-turn-helix domain-containing protein n=1 Tax=Nocardia coffeae TaxID=2873381 RepID=UPI001CA6FA28|nr:helix-turn-helix domain-containing protein [Nocardia coffeae]MBY8861375.1 helix-turn-helix domain-containing protein [Nocardia coffeae]